MTRTTFRVNAIGYIRTPYTLKYSAPRQPGDLPRPEGVDPPIGTIHLFPGHNYEQAVQDLDGFERVWIISWFDRNQYWRPKVLPPRGGRSRRGVFATRSPHRPNPIGLSLCRIRSIRGRMIDVQDPDLLDRTPVLDLKPYLPYAEAFPLARAGWAEDGIRQHPHAVHVAPRASDEAAWLAAYAGIDLLGHALRTLSLDPAPHPYRRTKALPDGTYHLAMGSWRVRYRIRTDSVLIEAIESGYDRQTIAGPSDEKLSLSRSADLPVHRAFLAWQGGTKDPATG